MRYRVTWQMDTIDVANITEVNFDVLKNAQGDSARLAITKIEKIAQ